MKAKFIHPDKRKIPVSVQKTIQSKHAVNGISYQEMRELLRDIRRGNEDTFDSIISQYEFGQDETKRRGRVNTNRRNPVARGSENFDNNAF